MKKAFTFLTILCFVLTIQAESPQKMSYQAVVRNTQGALVVNKTIGMKISIYYFIKTTAYTIYSETQTPTTNENGLVTIGIGTGNVVSGIFADIDWAARSFYLKIEIDPGGKTSYSITSDTQIMSVPYALHAKTATTAQSLTINGGTYTPDCVVDVDGNAYKTVKIGTQVWMAENLKTTHYRNGDVIPNITENTAWGELTTGAWCDINFMAVNGSKYGHLYNWYAVTDPRNIAPEGWHVPSDAEWTELENYLITNGGNYDGTTTNSRIAKSLAAISNWNNDNTVQGAIGNDLLTNNSSGFTALPGGSRFNNGGFGSIGGSGYWWSSTENGITLARYRYLGYNLIFLGKNNIAKSYGYSVRCIRD